MNTVLDSILMSLVRSIPTRNLEPKGAVIATSFGSILNFIILNNGKMKCLNSHYGFEESKANKNMLKKVLQDKTLYKITTTKDNMLYFTKRQALINIIICIMHFLVLYYLFVQNYTFNYAKYKSRFLFNIIYFTPNTFIRVSYIIIFFFYLNAIYSFISIINVTHMIEEYIILATLLYILVKGFLLDAVGNL